MRQVPWGGRIILCEMILGSLAEKGKCVQRPESWPTSGLLAQAMGRMVLDLLRGRAQEKGLGAGAGVSGSVLDWFGNA